MTKMPVSYTKKLTLLFALITCGQLLFAAEKTDSLKKLDINLDSLKKQVQLSVNDSLKGQLYTAIAGQYMQYDTIKSKKIRIEYQDAAIANTLKAIHYFSKYNDTIGLRMSFDNLAKVYHAQKKYPQTKWFILQSNSLSRGLNDNPNIIASLIELAALKTEIKDYSLAMRDLNEALTISSKNHYARQESLVQLNYAMLYTSMKNTAKSAKALQRHLAIDDSIKKAEQAILVARIKAADSLEQAKKKEYLSSSKGPYAFNFSKTQNSLQYLSLSLF